MWQWIHPILERIRFALRVLINGPPKQEKESDNAVAEVIAGLRKPGFPCPNCNERIIVDILTLLAKSTVYCPKCKLELRIDWNEDDKAKQTLERVLEVSKEIEKYKSIRL